MVRQPEFWLLWLCFGVGVGGDLLVMNILSSIVHDRGLPNPEALAHTCVILVASCDTLARFLTGFLNDKLAKTDVSLFLVLGALCMVLGQLCFAMPASPAAPPQQGAAAGGGGHSLLFLGCVLIGASDGMFWSAGPIITGSMFGVGGRAATEHTTNTHKTHKHTKRKTHKTQTHKHANAQNAKPTAHT